jgi:hypothetical protein
MLGLTKGNGSSLSLSMVKGGGWLLLSTSDNEVGIVVAWPLVVGVVVEQERARDEDEFLSSPNIVIPGLQHVTQP